jgi:GNAT superfamily N-acetyltransferase
VIAKRAILIDIAVISLDSRFVLSLPSVASSNAKLREALAIDPNQLPSSRKFPKRVACVLLGRLAVDQRARGRALGRLMLLDAIARTRTTIAAAAAIGLVVDALNERAAAFYRSCSAG